MSEIITAVIPIRNGQMIIQTQYFPVGCCFFITASNPEVSCQKGLPTFIRLGRGGNLYSKKKLQSQNKGIWELMTNEQKESIRAKIDELKEGIQEQMDADMPCVYIDVDGNLVKDAEFEMQISSLSEEEQKNARIEMEKRRKAEEVMDVIRQEESKRLRAIQKQMIEDAYLEREKKYDIQKEEKKKDKSHKLLKTQISWMECVVRLAEFEQECATRGFCIMGPVVENLHTPATKAAQPTPSQVDAEVQTRQEREMEKGGQKSFDC